jgi:hypothetical protein
VKPLARDVVEGHNHRQIEQLNQRGGRMLSIVDLIQAGTISVEMAAYAMRAMADFPKKISAGGNKSGFPVSHLQGPHPRFHDFS